MERSVRMFSGLAVHLREVADYFLEVHCLMIACVCVCFAYARDKTGDLMCFCVVEIHSLMQIACINTTAGVISLLQPLTLFLPTVFCKTSLLIRLNKEKAWMSPHKLA